MMNTPAYIRKFVKNTDNLAVSLVGCAEKTECYECEKEKKCHQYEISFMGESEKGWLCKDCAKDTKEMCVEMGVDFKKVK